MKIACGVVGARYLRKKTKNTKIAKHPKAGGGMTMTVTVIQMWSHCTPGMLEVPELQLPGLQLQQPQLCRQAGHVDVLSGDLRSVLRCLHRATSVA